jgi:hypothetical protein
LLNGDPAVNGSTFQRLLDGVAFERGEASSAVAVAPLAQ